jgi:hypothetical protein
MAGPVVLRGFRETSQAFNRMPKELKGEWRGRLRGIAVPIQRTAETLAYSEIPRIGQQWGQMRIGVTQKLVYVAPKQRGIKRGSRKRPNLAPLLMSRAMEPALHQHENEIVGKVEHLLDVVGQKNGF